MKAPNRLTFMLLLMTFLGTSCGMPLSKKNDLIYKKGETTKMYAKSDETFTEYIEMFEASAAEELENPYYQVGDVPVNFGDTENEEFDGVCFSYPDNSKEVIIKKAFWDRASVIQKRVLIFHELGHCALGRTHDDDTMEHKGIVYKTSVMNPVIPDSVQYLSAESEFKRELFTLDKEPLKQKILSL